MHRGNGAATLNLPGGGELYSWPTMAADIKTWSQSCDPCQRVKSDRRKPKVALQPLEVSDRQ